MIRGKKVFITGGGGFIGTSLSRRLLESNNVTVFDNLHRNAIKYSDFLKHQNLRFIEGDVLDAAKVRESMEGCDTVVHLASIAGVATVISMPVKTMEVAMIGTYNVLKAAMEQPSLERFIDFSTSEVFGRFADKVKESDPTPIGPAGEPRWTYAAAKLAGEHLAFAYNRQAGLPAVTIRPFNIFGPMQVGIGAIHVFARNALKGEPIRVNNGGTQVRSWCYIDDIVDAIILCMEKKEAVGNAFNIGNPRNTLTVRDLGVMIKRIANSGSEIIDEKKEMPDVETRCPDISKARQLLGFDPKVDLEAGLKMTIEWYRGNLNG